MPDNFSAPQHQMTGGQVLVRGQEFEHLCLTVFNRNWFLCWSTNIFSIYRICQTRKKITLHSVDTTIKLMKTEGE